MNDKTIEHFIKNESYRQNIGLELIASENYVSEDIKEACGSCLTNKYAEGYSGARYYGGCENVDKIEDIAKERLTKLFNCEYCNVQPHSGSQANQAVFMACLQPGDTVLGMGLKSGGHLTHGYKVSFSGKFYNAVNYEVDQATGVLDYDAIMKQALEVKPKLIVCGASAYSRKIDFKKFREIADACGAYLLADIAHIAGLVAVGEHMSPIPYCDFVTSTTHKTLRGPRGGIIMCKQEWAKAIDSAVFPGCQGGPLMHIIAAKAICFCEALQPSYATYIQQVIKNAKVMADTFIGLGLPVISGGTDNHLLLLDVSSLDKTGAEAEELLQTFDITVNKNGIPGDKRGPRETSGIRIGTAALTTRGMTQEIAQQIAVLIYKVLTDNSAYRKELLRKSIFSIVSRLKEI